MDVREGGELRERKKNLFSFPSVDDSLSSLLKQEQSSMNKMKFLAGGAGGKTGNYDGSFSYLVNSLAFAQLPSLSKSRKKSVTMSTTYHKTMYSTVVPGLLW